MKKKYLISFLLFLSTVLEINAQIVPFSFVQKPANNNINPYSIIPDGLTLNLDASVSASYPGSGNGTTWYDLSPTGGYSNLYNTSYSSLGGGSIAFNGSNAYGLVVNSSLNKPAYTKQVWVYFKNLGYANNVLSGDDHYLYPNGSSIFKTGQAGTFYVLQAATSITVNTWINIVVTFNTTDGWKMYFNGSLDATNSANKNPTTGSGTIYLGAYSGGYVLYGNIGQALVYNRALTATEVLHNYNVTKTRFGY